MSDRELDAQVAEKFYKYRVSWWSLYPIEQANGECRQATYGMECLLPNDKGDMPILEMLQGDEWVPVPHYSTDDTAAMLVVEKMTERWPGASERFVMYKNHGSDEWCVGWQTLAFLRFEPGTTGWVDTDKMEKHQAPMASADTLPLAICKAAVMAAEAE